MRMKWITVGGLAMGLALAMGTAGKGYAQEVTPESRLQKLSDELNLTADQKAKLKPIFEDEAKQIEAVRNDTSLAKPDKLAKVKQIHQSFEPKVDAILTPEQQEKMKQIRQQAREKARESKAPPQN